MVWILRNIFFYFVLVVVFQVMCNNYLTGDPVSFTPYVVYIGTGLLALVMLIKLKLKWTGIRTLNSQSEQYKFSFTRPLSRSFLYWTRFNHLTEGFISIAFSLLIFLFEKQAWPFSLLLFANGAENLFYLYTNQKRGNFKMAVNDYAVVHNARGTVILPFDNLKSIEKKYDEWFFIYKDGETITIPLNAMSATDTEEMRDLLDKRAREMNIYFSASL